MSQLPIGPVIELLPCATHKIVPLHACTTPTAWGRLGIEHRGVEPPATLNQVYFSSGEVTFLKAFIATLHGEPSPDVTFKKRDKK